MTEWNKEVLKLKEDHTWSAKPGYRIFVADRGAVRFDFPQDWVLVPGPKSIKFHDREPPDDNCVLEVTIMRLPPIDWSGLPLTRLVQEIVEGDERPIISKGQIHEEQRPDLEIAWTEIVFTDPQEHREARSRICLARGSNIQPLITLDFWAEDAVWLSAVWDEVIHSLELGLHVDDPTRGYTLH